LFSQIHMDIIGGLAGLLTTMAFVPQVIKVVRSRSTGDLSFAMFLIFTLGVFLWLLYGFCMGSIPIILANLATFLLSITILFYKVRYG
jgi:MtN3 and saliva related transmembrane protein